MSCKHSEHLTFVVVCATGEGGPRWRGTNEELTGLLDCSMSLCSHIFRRRSRSFNSCSLVLRSLSSFLSLSSVASISHLHVSAAKQRFRYIKAYYDASVCQQLQWDQTIKLTMLDLFLNIFNQLIAFPKQLLSQWLNVVQNKLGIAVLLKPDWIVTIFNCRSMLKKLQYFYSRMLNLGLTLETTMPVFFEMKNILLLTLELLQQKTCHSECNIANNAETI